MKMKNGSGYSPFEKICASLFSAHCYPLTLSFVRKKTMIWYARQYYHHDNNTEDCPCLLAVLVLERFRVEFN